MMMMNIFLLVRILAKMTNKELQELLRQYPDDLPVYLHIPFGSEEAWHYRIDDIQHETDYVELTGRN